MKKEESQRFAPGSMDHVLSQTEFPEIREKILRIAHESGVKQEDPVWTLILLILEAHEAKAWSGQACKAAGEAADRTRNEIRNLPSTVKIAVEEAMTSSAGSIVAAADGEVQKSVAAGKASMADALNKTMSDAVTKAIDQIVKSTAAVALKIQARKWLQIGIVTNAIVIFVLAGGAGWYGYKAGRAGGFISGVKIGEYAQHFLKCDRPGWKIGIIKGVRVCWPYPMPDGTISGWPIP